MNMKPTILILLLAVVIAATVIGCRKKSAKGGSAHPEVRNMMFADLRLSNLVKDTSVPDDAPPDNLMRLLKTAADHIDASQSELARQALKAVLAKQASEERVNLLCWSELRRLGETPAAAEADIVRGVVVEVPLEGGIDSLSGYADGTARYLNFSGATVIWDRTHQEPFDSLCRKLLDAAEPNFARANSVDAYPLPKKDQVHITLLTYGGARRHEANYKNISDGNGDFASTFQAGTELMFALMKASTDARKK